jgi:hypothetical protein
MKWFLALIELAALAAGAKAQEDTRFFLKPDGTVEARIGSAEKRIEALEKKVAALSPKPTAPAPKLGGLCPCGADCQCADGTCPFGCPVSAQIAVPKVMQVCGPDGCRLISATAPAPHAAPIAPAPPAPVATAATPKRGLFGVRGRIHDRQELRHGRQAARACK